MKKLVVVLFVALSLFSCEEKGKKQTKTVGKSEGRWNSLLIVMPNDDWKGALGDSIRTVFASPVKPLPNFEPHYTMTQISNELFSGYLTKQRNILIVNVKKDAKKPFLYKENAFAKPQQVFQLNGDKATIIEQLAKHKDEMLQTLQTKEMNAFNKEQNNTPNSATNTALKKIGLQLQVPSSFELAENKGDFFWFIKDIKNGYSNLVVYDFPMAETPFDSIPNYILKKRNEIGKKHIPGQLPNTYVVSETQFSPYVSQTTLAGNDAFVSKGLWKIQGDFMGGPYINYTIKDTLNKRYLVLEGFVFAPNVHKRNYLFELEAAIKTAKIIKKE